MVVPELAAARDQNTIVFFHAPLWSEEVLKLYPPAASYIAQPAERFRQIVLENPQIKLWVSGHIHFGMVKELIMHRLNSYAGRVFNILNCDLDGYSVLNLDLHPVFHDNIWTR
jgi:hypothetical protein